MNGHTWGPEMPRPCGIPPNSPGTSLESQIMVMLAEDPDDHPQGLEVKMPPRPIYLGLLKTDEGMFLKE